MYTVWGSRLNNRYQNFNSKLTFQKPAKPMSLSQSIATPQLNNEKVRYSNKRLCNLNWDSPFLGDDVLEVT